MNENYAQLLKKAYEENEKRKKEESNKKELKPGYFFPDFRNFLR